MTSFRRVFIDHGAVGIETGAGQRWCLPNPTPEGKTYDPATLLRAVVAARSVNLERWRKM